MLNGRVSLQKSPKIYQNPIASWTVSVLGESALNFIVERGHLYLIDMEIKKKKNMEKEKPKGTEYAVTLFIKDITSKRIVCKIVNYIHR